MITWPAATTGWADFGFPLMCVTVYPFCGTTSLCGMQRKKALQKVKAAVEIATVPGVDGTSDGVTSIVVWQVT